MNVLPKLKAQNITFYIIPLTNNLNMTINEFQKYIDIKHIDFNSSTPELSELIADTVCKMLEDPELSAME